MISAQLPPGKTEIVTLHFQRVIEWFDRHGWAGNDPYDLLGLFPFPLFMRNRHTRYISHKLNERCPHFLRKLYGFHPAVNPKTVALMALAYQNLYRSTGENRWAQQSQGCLDWLLANSSSDYSGRCWGYPFGWQSRTFYPRGTPTSVVTAICCQALLNGYQLFQRSDYVHAAESCGCFFLNDLRIDRSVTGSLCFSYTPKDLLHVHNANLWTAFALCHIGAVVNKPAFTEQGLMAVRYSLDAQMEDGSWDYFGPPDVSSKRRVDVYHTGFVLRCLYEIFRLVEDQTLLAAVKRGYSFLLHNLIVDGSRPKFRDDREYPVDIHACAEAILCSAQLQDIIPEAQEVAWSVALWTIEQLSDSAGRFYYRKYPHHTIKTTYIRWGQAWMFLALSRLLRIPSTPP